MTAIMKKGSILCTCALLLTLLLALPGAAVANAVEAPGASTRVLITVGDTVIEAELNNSPAAAAFLKILPAALPMRRVYDREFYTVLSEALPFEGQQTFEQYELGDIAFWTKGDYFGILYSFDRPELSAPIVKVGRVTSSLDAFKTLGSNVVLKFELAKGEKQ